ncbi:MAG: SDR family oxidoreductase [Flavobacteriales bacterium]|nr:SDR family oxidoreductase [Flavobacteriales bacterium]
MQYSEPMFKDKVLKNKTIVVTGGGTGLGRSMSTYFSKLGANVVITSRKLEVLQKTASEITEETGGNILAVACDVRKEDDVQALLSQTLEEFGTVNGLLNNAAGNFISPTERLSPKAFGIILDIVLKGTINCTLTFGKHWIEKKSPATVLNIVTTYATTGSGFVVPSACAKGGVLAMTRSLAVEWAKYNIRFNAIAPGPFPTKGAWERLVPQPLKDKIALEKRIPLKRMGEHQELANLAAYVMSDFASYMNGEVITIDGGEWLQGAGQFNGLEAVPDPMWDAIEQYIRSQKGS